MKDFVHALSLFNAKERFWLVAGATGYPALSAPFRKALARSIGVAAVPRTAWWAMDFHIDWLEAALLSLGALPGAVFTEPEVGRNLNRNQQDVDLVVAWDSGDVTHLVFLEAKGVSSWGNAQYAAKIARLVGLFGLNGKNYVGVEPAFVLSSPARPQKLGLSATPSWALDRAGRPRWVRLEVPVTLHRPERCDAHGRPSKVGTHWRIVPRKIPGAANAKSSASSPSQPE